MYSYRKMIFTVVKMSCLLLYIYIANMAKLNHSEILSFKGYNVHVPNFSKLVCGIFYMHSVCAVQFVIQNTLNCNLFYRWLIFCLIFCTQHLLSPEEYTPPKKMIEFSRKHQEEEMVQTLKEEIQQLTTDEADLEVGFIGYIQLS